MSDPSPYQPPQPYGQPPPGVAEAREGSGRYPIEFLRKPSAQWLSILHLGFGVFCVMAALFMFAVNLFLIDARNQLVFHGTTTLPMILGVFSLINFWNMLSTPDAVRIWQEGIEIDGATSHRLAWDDIEYATVVDAVGGMSKKLRLLGKGGKPLTTISSGIGEFKSLAQVVCETVAEHAPKEEQAAIQSKRGRRMSLAAIALGIGMLIAGTFIIYDGWWKKHAQDRLAEESVAGQGTVTRHFVAPNGRTKRIEYEVEGDHGKRASHNVEVEAGFHESIQEGDSVDVRYVPDDPRISELAAGEIPDNNGIGGPLGSMLLGIVALAMSLFAFAASVMFWKGYDLKYEDGKFRFAPV